MRAEFNAYLCEKIEYVCFEKKNHRKNGSIRLFLVKKKD